VQVFACVAASSVDTSATNSNADLVDTMVYATKPVKARERDQTIAGSRSQEKLAQLCPQRKQQVSSDTEPFFSQAEAESKKKLKSSGCKQNCRQLLRQGSGANERTKKQVRG
jgi:hypothetical protein